MSSNPRPTDQELAAFIDGKLKRETRERVIRYLNREPEDYRIVVEAIRTIDRLEEPHSFLKRSGAVKNTWSWKSWRAAGLAAAVLLLILTPLLLLWHQVDNDAAATVDELASDLLKEIPAERLSQAGWSETLISMGFSPLPTQTISFRLGRLMLDLRISWEASDEDRLFDLTEETQDLLRKIDSDQLESWNAFQQQLSSSRSPDAEQLVKATERSIRATLADDRHFEYGMWAEAARLAAVSRFEAFFRRPKWDKLLEQFEADAPDPAVQGALRRVRGLTVGTPSLPTQGWIALEQALTDVIVLY